MLRETRGTPSGVDSSICGGDDGLVVQGARVQKRDVCELCCGAEDRRAALAAEEALAGLGVSLPIVAWQRSTDRASIVKLSRGTPTNAANLEPAPRLQSSQW